ncbi:hypothetical protein BDN67DRAFT_951686 [Paxillus ammoniavirescens]|nr:hypothetical protein BDN67DRAFT_951686 [Paxillus ammoniavirescens]
MSLPQSFLQDLWIRKSVGLAGYSCLVYDYILTLDEEVRFIWKAPWSITKVTFLVNRYGNLLGQTFIHVVETGWIVHDSQDLCQRFNLFISIFMTLAAESIHILVLLRAWAIWGCQRRVATILIGAYCVYLLLILTMVAISTKNQSFHQFQYLDLIGICVGVIPPYVWLLCGASLLLDSSVFWLTMRSLRRHSQECRHLYPSGLVHLLVRDAVTFYVVSIFYEWFTVVTWTLYANSPKNLLSLTFSLPLLSIGGQRLVLNVRGLKGRSYTPRSLSAEVDRQLEAFDDAQPGWWSKSQSAGASGSGSGDQFGSRSRRSSRKGKGRMVGLTGGVIKLAVISEGGDGDHAEDGNGRESLRTDVEALELEQMWQAGNGGRSRTPVGLETVTEVPRTPDNVHIRDRSPWRSYS